MNFKMEFIAGSKMQKAIILTIVSNLAIGVVLCAPSNQQTTTAAASSSTGSQSAAASQSSAKQSANGVAAAAAAAASADKPKSTATNQFSSAATSVSGSPSIVNLRSADGSSGAQRTHAEEMDVFDGKNPFADDSLWQIPIHLVRDLSAGRADEKDDMAKSSSEVSNADDDDDNNNDEEMAPPASSGSSPHGSPSSPTVISASTDLKTAAGYHYPSSHEHHGYGHESAGYHGAGHHDGHHAGHHGGHYGPADHHYGKYFQYASVPYPGAWEFGYRRGNPYHTIERYEHAKGPHFKTKVKWSDKHGGYGVHVWDYNHDDHHSHHYGGGGGDHYESHKPAHYGGSDGHHHGGHHHGGGHYGYH